MDFTIDIELNPWVTNIPKVNLNDAYQNLKIISKIYKNSKYDYLS